MLFNSSSAFRSVLSSFQVSCQYCAMILDFSCVLFRHWKHPTPPLCDLTLSCLGWVFWEMEHTAVSDSSMTCRRVHWDANGHICAHMRSDTQLLGNHMSPNVLPGGQTADPTSKFIHPLETTRSAHTTLTQFKTSLMPIRVTWLNLMVFKLCYERLSVVRKGRKSILSE